MLGLIFDKTMDIIYLFKFKDEIFEHLQTKKVSLNFKSSLLNQYFPIAFQLSNVSLII
jgi:hypothetical protein